ncbi:MAG TPA: cupredoxin domain-containing protein [Bacillales bacterium]|nr:cupredoxin domain-containing protein [Bacillales bacterium]
MVSKKRIITMLVLFVAMMIVTGWGTNSVAAQSPDERMEKAKAIEIELNEDYFHPKIITLLHNQPTTLVLKNKGKEEHTFTVKRLSIDVEVKPGKTKSITVQPKKPGTYRLFCSYHKKEGMVGKVIVK